MKSAKRYAKTAKHSDMGWRSWKYDVELITIHWYTTRLRFVSQPTLYTCRGLQAY